MKRTGLTSLAILLSAWTFAIAQENQDTTSIDSLPVFFRGLDLSDDQRRQANSVAAQFRQQLSQLTTDRNGVFTEVQQSARLAAIRKGRQEGKSNRELRIVANSVIDLSPEQMDRIVAIENRRRKLQKAMQTAFFEILTPQQNQKVAGKLLNQNRASQDRRAARIRPTHSNVAGHAKERPILKIHSLAGTKHWP